MKEKILIVDDEKDILELISFNLEKEGYKTTTATSGEDALSLVKQNSYDLLILDLMLPGIDGFDLCRIVKSDEKLDIPIIMLTAKSTEVDKIAGLEIGADHYLTKPFSLRELIATIKATLRTRHRATAKDDEIVEKGPIKIHRGKHEVFLNNKIIKLTTVEFRILSELIKRPGWVLSRTQLIESTRGEDIIVTDRTIDVHIVSLRKKLGKFADIIDTVRGVGYKFKELD
jgi:two-component system, OmpR family, alkaline phosphatase synthesis response regulator PhoP